MEISIQIKSEWELQMDAELQTFKDEVNAWTLFF